jgi:hypothetical protein
MALSLKNVSTHVAMISLVKPFRQKRFVLFACSHSGILTRRQDQCIANCAEKFLKHSERVGARFADINAGS